MLVWLKTLAMVTSIATHSPCGVVDNSANVGVRAGADGGPVSVYRYDGELIWRQRPPLVVRMAAATLTVGRPGPKIRVACNVTSGIL